MTIELKKGWLNRKQKAYSDIEVIEQLQQRSRSMEEWFYKRTKRYFDEHYNEVFFDKDRKQEIFQSAFLKLWMEIDNHRICIHNDKICRQQKLDDAFRPMTCSLTTFMMAFAKTEYRELMRKTKETYVDELFDESASVSDAVTGFDIEEDEETVKGRLVDECIQQMSPRCIEILTLFYYQGKSLDEILEIRMEKGSSKNGLKTAKNKCMNTLKERLARYEMFKV